MKICHIKSPCHFLHHLQPASLELSTKDAEDLKSILKLSSEVEVTEISAQKPDYEIGASSQLKLSFAPKAEAIKESVAKVWSLANDMADDEVELINDDDLLDEDDLVKPDPSSLRGQFIVYSCLCCMKHLWRMFDNAT